MALKEFVAPLRVTGKAVSSASDRLTPTLLR